MTLWQKFKYLLPSHRRAIERDMQEELRSLNEIMEGRELGNLTLAAENAREVLTWRWLENTQQDIRYALRSMFKNKVFTSLAVLSLALGIGAYTAIYSFMEAILLRSLPVPDAQSLVVMKWRAKKYTSAASHGMSWSTGGSHSGPDGYIGSQFPYPALKLFQENRDVLSSAFCYFVADRLNITVNGQTDATKGHYVSGDYFAGMGVSPAAGRLILPSDDELGGSSAVAVLSYRFAQRRFGAPALASGQPIRINDQPFVVIGVTPQEFFGAEPGSVPDVYMPMPAGLLIEPGSANGLARQFLDKNFYWIEIMSRLRPGVTLVQAQSVLAPQFRRFAEDSTSTEQQRAYLPELTIQDGAGGLDSLRWQYGSQVYVLMVMVALILLIACANLANLLVARATARRREIAVRLSIGANRLRVIRQLLTESVLLATIGGALGVAVAMWGIRVLTLLLANGRENFTLHAELNWNVLGVTFGLSVFTGLLFGLAPSIQATRVDVMPALKELRVDAKASGPQSRVSMARGLVLLQIAFSLVLLVGAGLFGRTLSNLHSINIGFNRENVLLFTITPRAAGYEGAALHRLYAELRERLTQVPGVSNVSLSTRPLPMGGGTMAPVTISDASTTPPPDPNGRPGNYAVLSTVGAAFFKTMQIPLIGGREFQEQDNVGAPLVAVVNVRLARMFGLENPVGHTISLHQDTYRIVGIVEDALSFQLKGDLRPVVYFPYMQGSRPPSQMTYEVRSAGNPLNYAKTVREIARGLDSRLALSDLKTQAAHLDETINQEIALARLCSVFAALALIIACVGLYGTVAFNVARRTGEIGIRMALGAERSGIIWMVLREVLTLGLVGLGIGVPTALAGSSYIESFLYGIQHNDPMTISAAVAILLGAGLLAGYLPARRAAGIDPMVALRNE